MAEPLTPYPPPDPPKPPVVRPADTKQTSSITPTGRFGGSLTRLMHVALRYRLDDILLDEELQPPEDTPAIRLIWRYFPTRILPQPKRSRAQRLRLALEHLGPVFIKFGQILSTRRDLLPPEYANELALLQDHVPPFDGAQALDLVTTALGTPLDVCFTHIDQTPLASASVAQVHAATLTDGTEVVVKVIRPDIEPMIREDVQLLRRVAELLEKVSSDARRLHLVRVVDDFDATILGELDLELEADNTVQLRHNFAESELLYVPRVYRELCRSNVLVLERVYGVPIANIDQLHEAGTNMRVLAERGVQTFFTQVFIDNFFHADMHPGNIFVDVTDPENPRYIAIDCAIIGELTAEDQDYLARNVVAFFNRDYAMVANLHLESGWIPEDTEIGRFERVIQEVCEPIFAKPLKEISFGHFLITLFQTARSFNMEVQPQLVLLQKTLLNIEGLGRQLYPDLDLWSTAKPFMEQWMAERTGPAAALRDFNEHAPAPRASVAATHGGARHGRHAPQAARSTDWPTWRSPTRNRGGARTRAAASLGCEDRRRWYAFRGRRAHLVEHRI